MVSNGEIRRNVTERIKPFRLKLLGYTILYSLIVTVIAGTINTAVSLLSSLIGAVIAIPIGAIFDIGAQNVQDISRYITQSISSIITIFTSIVTFVLSIGFMKEILLSMVNNGNKVSPIDFLKLGFEDFKRLAKVYLRLLLKNLPAVILIIVGSIVLLIGGLMGGENIVSILVILLGGLLIFAGFIWAIVIMLLYQSVGYEIVHDEVGLSAKEILVKSRETIRGHIWQWTRMNFFYAFIIFIIIFIVTIIFAAIMGISIYLASNAGNAAAVFGVILLIFGIILFVLAVMAASFIMQYFTSKNILNLDDLYQAIQTEKRQGVNPL